MILIHFNLYYATHTHTHVICYIYYNGFKLILFTYIKSCFFLFSVIVNTKTSDKHLII